MPRPESALDRAMKTSCPRSRVPIIAQMMIMASAMRIVSAHEGVIPISSSMSNAFIDFSTMDCSVLALVSDVVVDGQPVVGYGFNSNGRYSAGEILRRRILPRLLDADPDSLLDEAGGLGLGQLEAIMDRGPKAGTWALEARRIAAGVPRIGLDTDHRTIPNEIGMLGTAVHLDKGCYRGQETVARVHNLGRPPRRLVRLHLDGSVDALPTAGAELTLDGRPIGFVGGSARHFELGPIALGLIKRGTPLDAQLAVEGIAAAQEPLVDPEAGLHVRPTL